MQYLLVVLFGVAAYAGYKGWPLYTVVPIGIALVIWNLMYFGTRLMHIATGGPYAYLLRASIMNILQTTVAYVVGIAVFHLIG